ncbi:MAG: DUF2007 domain-containing protein [Granulosicoccus sp.]
MPQVYRAANIIDAQLVMDELQAGGIQARISGRYLSGAIGELPPGDVIAVWIDCDQHVARARALIEDFEMSRLKPRPDWLCRTCDEIVGGEFGACWNCGAHALAN